MQIGAMTNPYKDLLPQIHWIGRHGFDYVDLAVEPPGANARDLKSREILNAAAPYQLDIVVHTSPYLPLASRHTETRQAAWSELLHSVDLAVALNSRLVTIHYLGAPAFFSPEQTIGTYARLLDFLIRPARKAGVMIAIENSPANQGEAVLFREIFRQVPDARLLLDVGHTHLNTAKDSTDDFLADPILGARLAHVHISDNNGLGDLHLPPGSVRNGIDWPETIRRLRSHPYDGRITPEVFSPDPAYLLMTRDRLLAWWGEPMKTIPVSLNRWGGL